MRVHWFEAADSDSWGTHLIKKEWGGKAASSERTRGEGAIGFPFVHLAMQFELQLAADLAAFHTPLPMAESTKRIHTHKAWSAGKKEEEGAEEEQEKLHRGRELASRQRFRLQQQQLFVPRFFLPLLLPPPPPFLFWPTK